jgi:hypothetical protein
MTWSVWRVLPLGQVAEGLTQVVELRRPREHGCGGAAGLGRHNGVLTVSDATDSRLTMRLTPHPRRVCNPWTVAFTHLSGGDMKMARFGQRRLLRAAFEVRMSRQVEVGSGGGGGLPGAGGRPAEVMPRRSVVLERHTDIDMRYR